MKISRILQTHAGHLAAVISLSQTGMMHAQTEWGIFNLPVCCLWRGWIWNIRIQHLIQISL